MLIDDSDSFCIREIRAIRGFFPQQRRTNVCVEFALRWQGPVLKTFPPLL